MSLAHEPDADLPLRDPADIMTPEALSAFKASRLSFLRYVVRRMVRERWRIAPTRFDLDNEGRGTVVYSIDTPDRPIHFVVFSDNIPEERRTDRIVENHYDGEAFLCIGDPTEARIEAQRGQFVDFLLGRSDIQTLGWTRVNRSSRVFETIANDLAAGRQPDIDLVASAGYLVRNNGFWGSGRHGTAVMQAFSQKEFLGRPYHADLLTLYMWRHFSHDLVDHVARRRGGDAAMQLDPRIRRFIGSGNASGLGLVPFMMRHPKRINQWILCRETAIAQVKARPARNDAPEARQLAELLQRAITYYATGIQVRPGIFAGSAKLVEDLTRLQERLNAFLHDGTLDGATPERPWPLLCDWAAGHLHAEALEQLHSLLIEIYPDVADGLEESVLAVVDDRADVRPEQRAGDLLSFLRERYAWALAIDTDAEGARQHFWYLSYDNLEPRHGLRGVDPGEEFETFVDVVGEVQALVQDLAKADAGQSVAAFLFAHPQHRNTVERVQSFGDLPYGEVRANVLSDDFEPCHLIRFLLTQYGMEKLDPQSRLWVRGTFLQGAPTADDLAAGVEGDWIFPMPPQLD